METKHAFSIVFILEVQYFIVKRSRSVLLSTEWNEKIQLLVIIISESQYNFYLTCLAYIDLFSMKRSRFCNLRKRLKEIKAAFVNFCKLIKIVLIKQGKIILLRNNN